MKKQCFVFSLLLNISMVIATQTVYQKVGFINNEIIKKDGLFFIEFKKKLNHALNNIKIQKDIYDDGLSRLDQEFENKTITKQEFEKQIKDLKFKRENLLLKAKQLKLVFEELIEDKIVEYIKIIAKKEGFHVVLPIELAFLCHATYDITYKVLNKLDIDWINKVEKKLDEKNGK